MASPLVRILTEDAHLRLSTGYLALVPMSFPQKRTAKLVVVTDLLHLIALFSHRT